MASIRARLVKLENKRRFLDWFVWGRFCETLTVDELGSYARDGTLPEPIPNRPSKMNTLDRKTLNKLWKEDEQIFGDRSQEDLIYFTKNGFWPEQRGQLYYSMENGKMIAEWKVEPRGEKDRLTPGGRMITAGNTNPSNHAYAKPTQETEKAEETARSQSRVRSRFSSPDCICFPEKEQPFFCSSYEQPIAAMVKCPLHGERFKRQTFFIYVASWLAEKEPARRQRLSPYYRKAWVASFPPELWPEVPQEETEDGKIFLRLKDGSRLCVGECARS